MSKKYWFEFKSRYQGESDYQCEITGAHHGDERSFRLTVKDGIVRRLLNAHIDDELLNAFNQWLEDEHKRQADHIMKRYGEESPPFIPVVRSPKMQPARQ